jgi:hypothetical protein
MRGGAATGSHHRLCGVRSRHGGEGTALGWGGGGGWWWLVVAQLGAGELHLQEAVGGLQLDERTRLGALQPRAGQDAGPVSLKRLLDESPWL